MNPVPNHTMIGAIFEHYVETQLARELPAGDVVILDNVGFHKSERAEQLVRERGAWLLPLVAMQTRTVLAVPMESNDRSSFRPTQTPTPFQRRQRL
ncbi:hypothetical protein ACFSQQ_41605 [Mesorhizobium kowhaii]|uniref:hypothetical protein n=1 Tax=Mesorhizobium kowhaii TaxID=1300272 RepID=UPI0035E58529